MPRRSPAPTGPFHEDLHAITLELRLHFLPHLGGDHGAVGVGRAQAAATGTAATSGGGLAVPLTYAAADAGVSDSKEEIVKYFKNASLWVPPSVSRKR